MADNFGMDKVYHFIASAAIVVAAYLLQLYVAPRQCEDYRLLFAAWFSLSIGITKEILDAAKVWSWCGVDHDCFFDGWDLLVDLNGVTAAVLYIIGVRNCCCAAPNAAARQVRDDATVASTVAPPEDEKEEAQSNDADMEAQLDEDGDAEMIDHNNGGELTGVVETPR